VTANVLTIETIISFTRAAVTALIQTQTKVYLKPVAKRLKKDTMQYTEKQF